MLSRVYIIAAKRTPLGAFQGQLSPFQGWQLGAKALEGVKLQTHIPEAVYMGNVLGAGQGQAPARQATISAFGVDSIPTVTVNKVCGSGMQSVIYATQAIQSGEYSVVTAGGMESMTNAPYLLPTGRGGQRMGHGVTLDHMSFDGLEDAFEIPSDGKRRSMGTFADATALKYGFSRAEQETFALETYENFKNADAAGSFQSERLAITHTDAKGVTSTISTDEPPTRVKPAKFTALKPAFGKNGTVTAATSSPISDGAAALTLCSEGALRGVEPLAKVLGYSSYAHDPAWFTTAPLGAINKLLTKLNLTVEDIDLFEVNEAFSVVPMLVMKELGIPRNKMNVHGGACTLGHPIGASGARIIVTLVHALKTKGLKRGIACVCIGGGEATAIAVEIC